MLRRRPPSAPIDGDRLEEAPLDDADGDTAPVVVVAPPPPAPFVEEERPEPGPEPAVEPADEVAFADGAEARDAQAEETLEVVPEPLDAGELSAGPELEITLEPEPAVEPEPEPELTAQAYESRLLDIVQDVLHRPAPPPDADARPRVVEYARRLLGTPLLADLADEELLAVVRGLRVHTFEAGDVIVTERQPGQSLFILTSGRVKVFVRNPAGRNYLVAQIGEGDFFGEIASLSGRPRTATVVAASATDLLELDKPTLDGIARTHPRVKDVLETAYIERASSPEAAAIRAVTVKDPHGDQRAIDVLEAHFGESRWDPRMRLRLADVLLRAGKDEDAVPVLVGLADDLARAGYPEKAIAILKKIERLQSRHIEEVSLAPGARSRRGQERGDAPGGGAPAAAAQPRARSGRRVRSAPRRRGAPARAPTTGSRPGCSTPCAPPWCARRRPRPLPRSATAPGCGPARSSRAWPRTSCWR